MRRWNHKSWSDSFVVTFFASHDMHVSGCSHVSICLTTLRLAVFWNISLPRLESPKHVWHEELQGSIWHCSPAVRRLMECQILTDSKAVLMAHYCTPFQCRSEVPETCQSDSWARWYQHRCLTGRCRAQTYCRHCLQVSLNMLIPYLDYLDIHRCFYFMFMIVQKPSIILDSVNLEKKACWDASKS